MRVDEVDEVLNGQDASNIRGLRPTDLTLELIAAEHPKGELMHDAPFVCRVLGGHP